MPDRGWRGFSGRRILLLQGPMGPFFRDLAASLRAAGAADVRKVNFNGGDWLFYPRDALNYRGSSAQWPAELKRILRQQRTDVIMLFGDCRPVHVPVHDLVRRLNVEVWVFEEGYVRPDFVTFERWGVNDRSLLPRDPDYYHRAPPVQAQEQRPVGNSFWHAALWSVLYFAAAILARPLFPGYEHHRPLRAREAWPWVRGTWRKLKYKVVERGVESRLRGEWARRYFLVPLQIDTDAQVRVHSDFASVAHFIETVVESFSRKAAPDDFLVFKHHPLDRGYHDYSALLRSLARKYGVTNRLLYIHDQHLPTLLANARGVIVINSTVGLSALHHGTPLIVVGRALYDIAGLTFQGQLDDFWAAPEKARPDADLYHLFRAHLINLTQINGNFYRGGVREPGFATRQAAGKPSSTAAIDVAHIRLRPGSAAETINCASRQQADPPLALTSVSRRDSHAQTRR